MKLQHLIGVALLALAPLQSKAATVLAIEYYHAGFDHYFMTSFTDEAAALDNGTIKGWVRTGKSFFVEAAQGTGLVPVCRFFSTTFAPKSSHFYTANAGECATVKSNPNWSFEANSFYVEAPAINGTCASGTKVYRLYNNGQGGAPNHRYTTDTTVRSQMMAKGWIPEGLGAEGVAFCSPLMDAATAYIFASRLLGGSWLMGYTFGSTYVDRITFTSIVKNTGANSTVIPWFINGVGPFSRPVTAAYYTNTNLYIAIWQYSSGSYNGYGFAFTDDNTVEGCYDYDAVLDNLFDNCSYLLGVRSASATGAQTDLLAESAQEARKAAAKL